MYMCDICRRLCTTIGVDYALRLTKLIIYGRRRVVSLPAVEPFVYAVHVSGLSNLPVLRVLLFCDEPIIFDRTSI